MSDIASIRLPTINPTAAPDVDGGPERAPTPLPPQDQESTVGDRVSISDTARAKALAARGEANPLPPQARELPEGVEVSRGGGNVTISRDLENALGGTRTRELSVTVDPQAQSVTRERSVTGTNGQSISVTGSVARTETGFEGSVTLTGPGGEEVTRTVAQSFDAEAGTFSRAVTLEGGTYNVSRNQEVVRTEEGFEASFDLSVERNDLPEAQGGPEVEAEV